MTFRAILRRFNNKAITYITNTIQPLIRSNRWAIPYVGGDLTIVDVCYFRYMLITLNHTRHIKIFHFDM